MIKTATVILGVSLATAGSGRTLLFVFPSAGLAPAAAAKALDPIRGIVDAFKTHDVVALGEGDHGNEQGAAFRAKLYRDPRFQAVVNDILVESGNGRYQAMMDRYVAGETVPEKELRKAWLETTQPTDVWDRDIYADMFLTIREINQTLPKAKQLRVLLGDTPYTYDPAKPGPGARRSDSFPAELIQREVIAKKRKALMVYGEMHYLRRPAEPPPPMPGQPVQPPSGTIVSLLERAGVKVFSVWTFAGLGAELPALQPDIASWKKPSLTLIKGTTLGLAPFTFYYPKGAGMMMQRGPNGPVMVDLGEAIGGVMQEQFDAVLYLGPKAEITYAKLSKSLCADPEYVEMRASRLSRVGTPGAPPGSSPAVDAFRMRCKEAVEGPRTITTPGLEALARRIIEGYAKGEPALDIMGPTLAESAKAQQDAFTATYARLGSLQSLTFTGSTPNGGDAYLARFAEGSCNISVAVGSDGKVFAFAIGPVLPKTPE